LNIQLEKSFSFKGNLNKIKYFEGWYYKLVSKDGKVSLAFIPGISLNKEKSHSFIQVILNQENESGKHSLFTEYITFTKDDFKYNKKEHLLNIQNCQFGLEAVRVNYKSNSISVDGQIKLSNLVPIKTNLFSPSIMGFFSYIPFMECYHSIVSMNHDLEGCIEINDVNYDFNGGKGYIEKDYGHSFPHKC
jgi:hypothetical protein